MTAVIVCGVGLGPGAERPLRLAANLAERLGGTLLVVHVAGPELLRTGFPQADAAAMVPGAGYIPPPLPADVDELEQRRRAVHRSIERLADGCDVRDAEILVDSSATPADGLRRVAAERTAELIVVGSNGHGTVRAAVLGSTSHSLAGDAPCPVVIAPASG